MTQQDRARSHAEEPETDTPTTDQPDPAASSDGDRSWTSDPVSDVDPDEDRSVEAVVERGTRRPRRPVRRVG